MLFYDKYQSLFSVAPAPVTAYAPTNAGNADVGRADLFAASTYAPIDHPKSPAVASARATAHGESVASIVAREWSFFQPVQEADRGPAPAKAAEIKPRRPRGGARERCAANCSALPAPSAVVRRVPANIEAKTSLVDFETAPFPYHGNMPGSDRPFLNAGEEGHRGHVNFHGHVFWEVGDL